MLGCDEVVESCEEETQSLIWEIKRIQGFYCVILILYISFFSLCFLKPKKRKGCVRHRFSALTEVFVLHRRYLMMNMKHYDKRVGSAGLNKLCVAYMLKSLAEVKVLLVLLQGTLYVTTMMSKLTEGLNLLRRL